MKEKFLLGIAVAILLLTLMPTNPLTVRKAEAYVGEEETCRIVPGYWSTSEYMIGRIAVSIILPESNGSIDPNLYNWTDAQIAIVKKSINSALDWWASQNPGANVTFVTEWHIAPTSYEPIARRENEAHLWRSEILLSWGYSDVNPAFQERNYVNDLRKKLESDWAFVIWVVNAFNDPDGMFEEAELHVQLEVGQVCVWPFLRTKESSR